MIDLSAKINRDGTLQPRGVDKAALKDACVQFEGLMVHQLLKEMRRTVKESDLLHGGNAEKIWRDMLDQKLGEETSRAGGLGLAEILYQQLLGSTGEPSGDRPAKTLEDYFRSAPVSPAGPEEAEEDDQAGELSRRSHPEPSQPNPEGLTLPVEGRVSSNFGLRRHPILGQTRMHNGVDLAASEGTPIKAALDGTVTFSGQRSGFGNFIELDHGQGLVTRYGHNQANLVQVGEEVKAGQAIGRVGSTGLATGPHLHFEARRHNRPLDPLAWLQPAGQSSAQAPDGNKG
jgi:murein DD-endopeptidase MepM/ murein hydrolase activator NlpD